MIVMMGLPNGDDGRERGDTLTEEGVEVDDGNDEIEWRNCYGTKNIVH